ncbi:hypothetical protein TBLA_0B01430 [Henningerozyma blattae CBS 6284]|uniref:Uncharacterized protein n=1 Tax=Henningerozyma blattae (strain ATCC 34711 / CBS 6284 / DSM 70876 / NBRC 10599 / NRRL Y-10934 / UCD 77-7) TaxID=1071380 RepID=I2GXY4_HENB6|nr:hypothetical protein TBLA_0B01430 [Tetrapisispora blattae CBS 6284]CCH58986.1 hypothetical protein TBLA_0B01430 [Tetrapisispora blattae CBS 6284]
MDTQEELTIMENDPTLTLKSQSPLLPQNIKALIAGGVGGTCAVLTGHPFDLIKVRCQNKQAESTTAAIKQILVNARNSALKNGSNTILQSVRGFYKGVVPPLLGVTPIFAVSFWGYDMGKTIVKSLGESTDTLTTNQLATAGFISAIPTTLVTAPTERVKVMLQISSNKSNNSLFGMIKQIVKTEGPMSLFKGSLATLTRDGPGSAIYFVSYELIKNKLNETSSSNSQELNITNVCLAGGSAGMMMWLTVFPIDTIKTKIQASSEGVNGKKLTMLSATKDIYKLRGGIKGFFPGLAPALLRSFPANAATFLGVELTHAIFKKYNI